MKKETKILMLGVLAVGAYLYFSKSNNAAAAPLTTIPDIPDYTGGDSTPGSGVISTHPVDYNQNIPVYTTDPGTTSQIVAVDSIRDGYLRSLKSYIKDPATLAAFDKMINAELSDAWYYVGTYLAQGIPLLQSTKLLANGQWDNTNPGNPRLYNAIVAMHNKYGIF